MPYCQHCGSPHADDASFCPQCGSWVGSVGSLPAQVVGTPYGGFWARLGAYLIDSLIVAIPLDILLALVGAYQTPTFTTTTDAEGNQTVHWHGDFRLFTVTLLAGYVVSWLYSALLQSSARQATIGEGALNLIVTDLDGNRISFGRATARYFASILSGFTLGIGYLMMLWTKRRQTLHDKIAETLVVRSPKR
jgi:uncharacterized RDD family membrane protein YckC